MGHDKKLDKMPVGVPDPLGVVPAIQAMLEIWLYGIKLSWMSGHESQPGCHWKRHGCTS